MKFHKYDATGNDFILVDAIDNEITITDEFVRRACARRTGIGSDGIIVAKNSMNADVEMRIFNADGSEAEMCGNGARALVLYMHHYRIPASSNINIETKAGLKKARITGDNGRERISINMGIPALKRGEIPVEGDPEENALDVRIELPDFGTVHGSCISMGNPHFVIFVERLEEYPFDSIAPLIEIHKSFPNRTNVEFIEVISSDKIIFRVWERGVGETLACGTGICASAVAAKLKGLTDDVVTVSAKGGNLEVDCSSQEIILSGPANHVYEGVIEA